MVGSSEQSRNCVRTTMKDAQHITCQSSHTCTRDPDAWIHQQEIMTQHPHAVADHGRRQHLTTTDLRDPIRKIFPLHHLGSRVVNKCTVLFKTVSELSMRPVPGRLNGKEHCGRSNNGKRLANYMVYVRCAAFFDFLSREFLMLIPKGRTEDIWLALRRREQREMKNKKRQSLTERQPVNSVEEGTERLGPSTECYSERRQRCDVLRTMRDARESVVAHSPDHGGTGSRDDAEQSHSACVYREATGRD